MCVCVRAHACMCACVCVSMCVVCVCVCVCVCCVCVCVSEGGRSGVTCTRMCAEGERSVIIIVDSKLSSSITTPQDAHKRLVLQVYLGPNVLEFSAIRT